MLSKIIQSLIPSTSEPVASAQPSVAADFASLQTGKLAQFRSDQNGERIVRERQILSLGIADDKTSKKTLASLEKAIAEGLLPQGSKTENRGITLNRLLGDESDKKVFLKTQIGETGPSFYVRLRNGVGKALDASTPIDLISGVCLFGGASISMQRLDGTGTVNLVDPESKLDSPLGNITVSSKLTAYEIESVTRLCACLQAVSKRGESTDVKEVSNTAPKNQIRSISIQIPEQEYFCYLIPALYDGNISRSDFQAYVAAVRTRSMIMEKYVGKELGAAASLAKFGRPLAALDDILANPPATAAEFKAAIETRLKSLPLLGALAAERELIAPKRDSESVNQTQALTKLLPVLSYLSFYLGQDLGKLGEKRRVLAIENASEERILVGIDTLSKKAKGFADCLQSQFSALYVAEQVVPITGEASVTTRIIPPIAAFRGVPIVTPSTPLQETLSTGPILYRLPQLMTSALRAEIKALYKK